jgi:hypothetical protein
MQVRADDYMTDAFVVEYDGSGQIQVFERKGMPVRPVGIVPLDQGNLWVLRDQL